MRRRRVSAARRLALRAKPGRASDYITHGGILRGDVVLLWCRVSSREQDRTGNLRGQEHALQTAMLSAGARTVGVLPWTGSGQSPYARMSEAARMARKLGATKIVAVSTDRFIRHPDFKATGTEYERDARASSDQLEELVLWANGIELVTLIHPDAPLSECMAAHKRHGQKAKGNRGGRPRKRGPYQPSHRDRCFAGCSKVFWLRGCGYSLREIGTLLGRPHSTIQGWERKLRCTNFGGMASGN